MRKMLMLLLVTSWPGALAGQAPQALNQPQSQSLYAEAEQALERTGLGPARLQALASLLERLRSLRGWNHSGDVYELLQQVRAQQAVTDALPVSSAPPETAGQWHNLAARLDTHFRGLLRAAETRLRNPDRDNLARYAMPNADLAPAAAGEQRVVFLGDSITDGWKLAEYFPGRPFVNRGISGQITGEMLGRMKADVIDHKPAAMVVLAGTNDLARGVAVEVIENNLSMIGDLARVNGIRVIFASILPVSDYARDRPAQTPQRPPGKIREINLWLQQHCRERGYRYLDYHSAMADERGLLKADLANDGLHPNAAGYRIMAPLAAAAIEQTLASGAKKAKSKQRSKT